MGKVFVVQELKRYHCPKCDSSYSTYNRDTREQTCRGCAHVYSSDDGVAKPVHDVTPAAVYGDVEVLINTNHVGISMRPLVAMFKNALKDFSDDDYILPTGDPVAIAVASIIAAKNNRGNVNFLRFDRQTRQYIKIQVKGYE